MTLHAETRLRPAYNIGSGKPVRFGDFVAAVRHALPNAEIHVGGGGDHFGLVDKYCVMDIADARRDLGYEPRYGLDEGVAHYIEHLTALNPTAAGPTAG